MPKLVGIQCPSCNCEHKLCLHADESVDRNGHFEFVCPNTGTNVELELAPPLVAGDLGDSALGAIAARPVVSRGS